MKLIKPTLLLSALVISLPSYALFGFGDDSDSEKSSNSLSSIASAASSLSASSVNTQSNSPVVEALTSQLDVSSAQATAGSGALFALASSQLSAENSSELSSLVPGLSSLQSSVPGLSSMATSMGSVTQIFESLGMDASMVSQYAPVLLQYLSNQGASSGLMSSLSSLWQTS
ncbi:MULTISPECIES: DUF2780 domain-containing protein [unclassified Vibrio]|uniref:DUF2780 domain-containing protein n=1 Tax=Vibrio sp. HB236076 TaxID=3232307 RepID=A0AB39HBE9_9VIBR|nr:DUF2780 domain-containing protein [Vibrio sp. HB161653]MDP5255603.1 DUF2780 domain-containing protein [Vibrio sp. HB161653]